MPVEPVYFDNNASTQPLPEVVNAVLAAMRDGAGNPSSTHHDGARARMHLARARSIIAGFLSATPEQIVFTSGGTEGNNTVLGNPHLARIITTAVEHPSVLRPAEAAAQRGAEVVVLPVRDNGVVDLRALCQALDERAGCLVSVQWANSETGIIQPIAEIAALCREHGTELHVDGAQAIGRLPVNLATVPIDFLTFSGHKLHGPPGTGVLFVRDPARLPPLLHGGGQEAGRRSGTENRPGIASLARACEIRAAEFGTAVARRRAVRDRSEQSIRAKVGGARVNGGAAPRVCSTTSIRFGGVDGQALLARFDHAGVVLGSQDSACSSHRPEPSHVLHAMGLSEDDAFARLRFSFRSRLPRLGSFGSAGKGRQECRHGFGRALGLQRLERAERAEELGEHRAPVAQQRINRPRAVAIADQPGAEVRRPRLVGIGVQVAREQLSLDPVGALGPPGGERNPGDEGGLECALRLELRVQRGLERLERGGILVAKEHELLRPQPVLEGVAGRARFARRGPGAARLGTVALARERPCARHSFTGHVGWSLSGCRLRGAGMRLEVGSESDTAL